MQGRAHRFSSFPRLSAGSAGTWRQSRLPRLASIQLAQTLLFVISSRMRGVLTRTRKRQPPIFGSLFLATSLNVAAATVPLVPQAQTHFVDVEAGG